MHLHPRTPFLALLLAPALLAQGDLTERIVEEGLRKSRVMEFQDYLCNHIGHRLTGSDGFAKACEWARSEFAAMGLDARLDPWGEWKIGWDRGQWAGRMVEPDSGTPTGWSCPSTRPTTRPCSRWRRGASRTSPSS